MCKLADWALLQGIWLVKRDANSVRSERSTVFRIFVGIYLQHRRYRSASAGMRSDTACHLIPATLLDEERVDY